MSVLRYLAKMVVGMRSYKKYILFRLRRVVLRIRRLHLFLILMVGHPGCLESVGWMGGRALLVAYLLRIRYWKS